MSLFDFFFPQIATAKHLRAMSYSLADAGASQRIEQVRQTATAEALKMRIDDLEKDLGFVVLMLGGLLSALDEKGHLTRDDVKRELGELDGIDGLRDGQLNIRVLKQYLRDAGT